MISNEKLQLDVTAPYYLPCYVWGVGGGIRQLTTEDSNTFPMILKDYPPCTLRPLLFSEEYQIIIHLQLCME